MYHSLFGSVLLQHFSRRTSNLAVRSYTWTSFSLRASHLWPPKKEVIFLILVLLLCGYLRFKNLDWGMANHPNAGWHPDETMVVSVDANLPANHFDTDMSRAPLYKDLQAAHYNFSSYYYAAYVWHAITARMWHMWPFRHHSSQPSALYMYRLFSAFLGLVACALVYGCARLFMPGVFAVLAALFSGVLPLLVQDSHYARAEAFVTAGSVGVLWLTIVLSRTYSTGKCVWAGLLVGILTACKISLGPLAVLPSIAILSCPQWHVRRLGFLEVKRLLLFLAACVSGFVLGVPYIVIRWRNWWRGWKYLQHQYASPVPPYGPDPPGYCFGYVNSYFLHTFGAPLLAVAAIGILFWLLRKQYFALAILAGTLAFYYLIFGFQQSFFERNLSHLAPWIAILAAVGCFAIYDQLQRLIASPDLRMGVTTLIVWVCLWIPLTISWRLAVVVLKGGSQDRIQELQSLLQNAYKGVPIVFDELWAPQVLERMQQQLASNPNGYIVRLGDANDELSRHELFIADHVFNLKLLFKMPGPFADLPTSTLQLYHGENYSWYLVRSNWPPSR